MEHKKCTKCGEIKRIDEFRKSSNSKDGHGSRCKECLRKIDKEYNAKNSDKRKQWKKNNPERVKECKKQWRGNNPEKVKEQNERQKEKYRLEHPKKILTQEQKQEKERQQKERVRQRAHERYIKNFKSEEKTCKYCGKKFMTEYKKSKVFCSEECARKNMHYRQKIADKRRKRLIKNSIMVDKDITLPKLFKRDKGVCAICGGKCNYKDFTEKDGIIIVGDNYPSIDHIKPLSKGGTHTWGNVQLAHKLCNSIKCDNIIEQEEEQLKWI